MDRALLLFEDKFPCWDEETFALVGENVSSLSKLAGDGLLVKDGEGYVLTEKGEKRRQECAKLHYLSALPIGEFDAEKALWNNRLYLLMERAFIGQFGIKEYSVNEALPSVPKLAREALWGVENGRVKYRWPESTLVRSFYEAFPKWGVGTRGTTPPGDAGMRRWMEENGAEADEVRFNLILRSRYDFELYRKEAHLPDDLYYMKDADRLFFLRATGDNYDEIYDAIGKLHLFLLGQRRVYIPGYADIDSQQQENWTMIVMAADNERELEGVYERLSHDGRNLIDPANPLFIVGTSIERLRLQPKPEYTVYDWFCDRSVHIVRPDV